MTLSIQQANLLYRSGQYDRALQMYTQLCRQDATLAPSLALNIKACERQLSVVRERTAEEATLRDIHRLWAAPVLQIRSERAESSELRLLMDSCGAATPSPSHLRAALLCAASSPFQRDLLWHAQSLAHRLQLTPALPPAPGAPDLSLASLAGLASDPTYWARERERIRSLGEAIAGDNRLLALCDHAPAQASAPGFALPPWPRARTEYRWAHPSLAAPPRRPRMPLGSISIGTVMLNEARFVGLSLVQHYDLCDRWVIVEGACQGEPADSVTPEGLSVDASATQVRVFPDPGQKLRYVPHGWTSATGEAGRCELRNRYLDRCDSDFLWVVDPAEFYTAQDTSAAFSRFSDATVHAVVLPQVHFWQGTDSFITGGQFDATHTRMFRHTRGMRYERDSRFPEIRQQFVHDLGRRKFRRTIIASPEADRFDYGEPRVYHMGFVTAPGDERASSAEPADSVRASGRSTAPGQESVGPVSSTADSHVLRRWGGPLPQVLAATESSS